MKCGFKPSGTKNDKGFPPTKRMTRKEVFVNPRGALDLFFIAM